MDIVKYKTNIDYSIDNDIVEARGESEQEPVYIVEWRNKSSEESREQTIPKTNMQAEIQMAQKEDGNMEIILGNVRILYGSLILNLKSEINYLKNQLLGKDTFFQDENTFLRRQLSEVLAKKVILGISADVTIGAVTIGALMIIGAN